MFWIHRRLENAEMPALFVLVATALVVIASPHLCFTVEHRRGRPWGFLCSLLLCAVIAMPYMREIRAQRHNPFDNRGKLIGQAMANQKLKPGVVLALDPGISLYAGYDFSFLFLSFADLLSAPITLQPNTANYIVITPAEARQPKLASALADLLKSQRLRQVLVVPGSGGGDTVYEITAPVGKAATFP